MTEETEVTKSRQIMDPVKRERIKAFCVELENPDRVQARGYLMADLRTPAEIAAEMPPKWGQCCLGVGCDVFARDSKTKITWDELPALVSRPARKRMFGTTSSSWTSLIHEVQEWFGFASGNPIIVGPDGHVVTAIHFNDEARWNFGQIAAGFRHTYLGVPYPQGADQWPT